MFAELKRAPREREEETKSPEEQIKSLIYVLGDKVPLSELFEQIDSLVNVVTRDYEEHRKVILRTIEACGSQLPHKLNIYALFVSALNAKNQEIGAEIAKMLTDALEFHLSDGKWREFQVLLRFIGELADLGFLPLVAYSSIVDELVSILKSDKKQNLKDMFAMTIMKCLVYTGRYLMEEDVEKYMEAIKEYIGGRVINDFAYKMFHSGDLEQRDSLEDLYQRLCVFKEDRWFSKILTIIDDSPFSDLLMNQTQHELRPLRIEAIEVSGNIPFQEKVFYLLDSEEAMYQKDSYPEKESMDRWILMDIVWNICHFFEINHKECVQALMLIDVPANVNRAIVETIFINLLSNPSFKIAYYVTLLCDLCKSYPRIIPKDIGKILFTVFEQMDAWELDYYALDRFSSWFALHLSNFNLKWPWDDWKEIIESENGNSRQKLFIEQTISKLLSLLYVNRVKAALPDFLHVFIPSSLMTFDGDETLIGMLKEKKSKEEINEYLSNCENSLEKLIHSIWKFGSKSFTFILIAIERSLPILKDLVSTDQDQIEILKLTLEFFQNNHQLISYNLVHPKVLMDFIFSNQQPLNQYWIWRIIDAALSKSVDRNIYLEKEKGMKVDYFENVISAFIKHSFAQDMTLDYPIGILRKYINHVSPSILVDNLPEDISSKFINLINV
ncbi:MIF4-like, type 1/2/3 domain-containing protein [Rozella allomycis CSF55]|uniref:MIF4-like, type 1/2/3 domain-containing protein n=1 Tax=Rozella allomycis (strain CSF55) TaxID=988480 RepID=A0A075B041_ROZAC|nr:MIF4-like, type 1/2/3 domain-containing protein [Rozella allomycis CSF55]|eukprot:EPZ35893.1 MIF4-like, type 1/2/3 domain-containing protein [Rozella allomycis CSF55]